MQRLDFLRSLHPTIPAAADLEKNCCEGAQRSNGGVHDWIWCSTDSSGIVRRIAGEDCDRWNHVQWIAVMYVQALENKNAAASFNDVTSTDLEAVQKNLRAAELQANDNEQYSRRNRLTAYESKAWNWITMTMFVFWFISSSVSNYIATLTLKPLMQPMLFQ